MVTKSKNWIIFLLFFGIALGCDSTKDSEQTSQYKSWKESDFYKLSTLLEKHNIAVDTALNWYPLVKIKTEFSSGGWELHSLDVELEEQYGKLKGTNDEFIRDIIKHFKDLRSLSLLNFYFSDTLPDFSSLPKLQELKIDQGGAKVIPSDSLPSSIANLELTFSIHDTIINIKKLSKLEKAYLKGKNKFPQVLDFSIYPKSLRKLMLNGNNISKIENCDYLDLDILSIGPVPISYKNHILSQCKDLEVAPDSITRRGLPDSYYLFKRKGYEITLPIY
ncbi:MAG: hypothetical protein JJT94_10265 [Bernardetiaceae bacterium]|nr:hypothetical protein [Bernardetiaceae bacterium]